MGLLQKYFNSVINKSTVQFIKIYIAYLVRLEVLVRFCQATEICIETALKSWVKWAITQYERTNIKNSLIWRKRRTRWQRRRSRRKRKVGKKVGVIQCTYKVLVYKIQGIQNTRYWPRKDARWQIQTSWSVWRHWCSKSIFFLSFQC